MSDVKRLKTPLTGEVVMGLRAGDRVFLSGEVYTARDAAHKRLFELITEGRGLPIELEGKVIYYVGPTPARPGQVIGSAGPTTSGRMDPFTPSLLERGLKGMIGKGFRSQAVIDAMVRFRCVYFVATGGAGALLAQRIKRAWLVAYEDLGPEAIRCLQIEDFPLIVVNDCYGRDLYKEGVQKYMRS